MGKNMKIIFLLQSFPCISETFILNQITGLIDLGCDIRIIAFSKSDDQKQHPAVSRYRLLDKTTYIRLPTSKWRTRLKAATQTLAGFVRHPVLAYRLQKILLADGRSYSYQKLFMALTAIRQGADILHCHYGLVGQYAIFLKDVGLKTKITTVFHGYDLSVYLNEHGTNVYQGLFAKGDLFLPVSEFWKQKLIALGCPADKIIVAHMGIDTLFFKPSPKSRDWERLRILTVARLTEKKGHIYALEAISRLLDNFPQLEYRIAGDGPLSESLKKIAHDLDIEGHVVFLGKIDAEDALELYQNADIFLLPSVTSSRGDMEGIPVSLMEAMACGLPVISTLHSGIPELVVDGQTGYLVPEKDVAGIVLSAGKLLSDPEHRAAMGVSGRKVSKKQFDVKQLNEGLVQLYRTWICKKTI